MENRAGRIVIAGTPIGNVGDAPPRLRELLAEADIVAAEDTRRALNLAARLSLSIGGSLVSLHDHNERERAGELIAAAERGATVLVVTDAGMPTVSDPGYRLVQAAAGRVALTVVPGPSAVLAALALSGLATDRFTFEGFLPRKAGERARAIADLAGEERTMIFFESPRRVAETLRALAAGLGEGRAAALARELTKTHEEVLRGTLSELAEQVAGGVLGEVTLVVAGSPGGGQPLAAALADVTELTRGGLRLKDAAAFVARRGGLSVNQLYRAALAGRDSQEPS